MNPLIESGLAVQRNGATSKSEGGFNGDATFTHAFSEQGLAVQIDSVSCSCGSPFANEVDTHFVYVDNTPPPGTVSIEYTMFIPLDHVRMPSWMQLSPIVFFEGDNKLVHSTAQPGFRIQQQIVWTSASNNLASVGLTGITKSYLPNVNLTSTQSCVRKNCTECASYLGVEDIVYQGKCKTGSSWEESDADGMSTVIATIVNQTSTSITIRFSGEPYNAIAFGASVFGDIDWSHDLTLNWSSEDLQWQLDYQHDGFPNHHIVVDGQEIYTFDIVDKVQTPLSLNGTGSGEWIGTLNGTF